MKTALIVDDSATIRRFVRSVMEGLGFACCEAADGAQALTICQDYMPTLIVLDWEMPVLDGLAFATALRAQPDGAIPKILFCTTHNDMAHIEKALGAGADEYVMKPFDREIIELKLRDVGLVS
ncbi:MAG TPA: response regulator [Acetobacteraceae bacterium]|jgi:two-component system, chemotaxis family, chemotaxis protein CheY|nr:response regulator [Acetobacteraceae bacterium]